MHFIRLYINKHICTYFICDFLYYQSKPHTQISRRTQTHTQFTKKNWIKATGYIYPIFVSQIKKNIVNKNRNGFCFLSCSFFVCFAWIRIRRKKKTIFLILCINNIELDKESMWNMWNLSYFPSRFVFHSTSHSILFVHSGIPCYSNEILLFCTRKSQLTEMLIFWNYRICLNDGTEQCKNNEPFGVVEMDCQSCWG